MRGLAAAVLVAAGTTGCAMHQTFHEEFAQSALGKQRGVCVGPQEVELCAITGLPPGSPMMLLVIVRGNTSLVASTGEWELTVTDPDGNGVFQGRLRDKSPTLVPRSGFHSLPFESTDTVMLPEPWRKGTYQFKMVFTLDADFNRELSLTLLD